MRPNTCFLCISAMVLFAACNNDKSSPAKTETDTVVSSTNGGTVEKTGDVATITVNAKSYRYDEVVTISGKIGRETFYGAPGYGENPATDQKEQPFLLILDNPIDVIGDQNPEDDSKESKSGITKIQLIFDDHAIDMNRFMGSYVQLTGTLFGAHTGHHHTPVLMDVTAASERK